ncbi:MAG: hypothetical protein HZC14_03845 [Candidatus Niyogibacteria bacterium]|nr:hypothetical protein [Candidatus Niyogibacteria bacterium]
MPKEYTVKQMIEAAKKTGEFGVSDEEMEEIFLNTVIENEEDLVAVLIFMDIHRPQVLKKITDEYLKKSEPPPSKGD